MRRAPSDLPDSEGDLSPHVDPARWDRLIESIHPAAMLVVITSSMSPSLRAECTPEDIWQETLASGWSARASHRWTGVAAFRAWLFEIARNRIRDAARKMKSQKRGGGKPAVRLSASDTGRSSAFEQGLPHDSSTPSRIVMHAERAAAILEALAALPPELEAVVRMHLVEELTMEVVAARLGIGISMAWRRFRKGSEIYSKALADVVSSRMTRRK